MMSKGSFKLLLHGFWPLGTSYLDEYLRSESTILIGCLDQRTQPAYSVYRPTTKAQQRSDIAFLLAEAYITDDHHLCHLADPNFKVNMHQELSIPLFSLQS
jgi:hypothetical protein